MTPEQAIKEADRDQLRPVYVVIGREQFLVDQVVRALRRAATEGRDLGFNDDKFIAAETSVDTVLTAARTAPMMARRRVVTLLGAERWEARSGTGTSTNSPLDELNEYAADPVPSTILLIVGGKLDARRRLVAAARKGGYLVKCDSLGRRELPSWIRATASARRHELSPELAETLAELVGPDLAPVADALERLSLYVGSQQPITEQAVEAVVTRVRQDTVWQLVDALGQRRLGPALGSLADAYDPRDGGLRLLGAVNWSVRQLIKFDAARRAGAAPPVAAKKAGVAPFKIKQVERNVSEIGRHRLEHWLNLLAETDLALKSSRRTGMAVLEAMLINMCR